MFDSTVFGSTSLAYEFRLSCLCKTTVSKWIIRKGRAHAIFIDFYKIHVRVLFRMVKPFAAHTIYSPLVHKENVKNTMYTTTIRRK